MKPQIRAVVPALVLHVLTFTARAHHGQEFFLLNDARVQAPGSGLIQSTFSFSDEGYADSLELNPGITLGVLPRTAISVTANFAQEENESWRYRSVEPSVLLDLTPRNFRLPIRFGVSFGYQFADGAAGELDNHAVTALSGLLLEHTHTEAELSGSSAASATSSPGQATGEAPHDHSTHDHSTLPAAGSGGESNPDALTPEEIAAMGGGSSTTPDPATPATSTPAPATSKSPSSASTSKTKSKSAATEAAAHSHTHAGGEANGHSHSHENSIHNHDDNLFTSRFTFEADLTKSTLLVGNLICSLPEGGSASWGYAVGLRQRLRPGFVVGFEAIGDFDRHGYQEALGAVYWEPVHHLTLKLGAGTGLSPVSPDATVRAGLIWMF
jgi:hypothetical protein